MTFAVTFMLGSLVTFAIASFLGAVLIRPFMGDVWRVIGPATGLALLSVLDLYAIHKNDYCALTLPRQTPKALARRHGMHVAAALWGFDMGTAVSTFRVASVTWGALMLVVFGWINTWSAFLYSTGFVAPLLFLMWTGRLPRKGSEHAAESLRVMLHRRTLAQWISAGLLALGAVLAVTSR
jgi:hypothetical protein